MPIRALLLRVVLFGCLVTLLQGFTPAHAQSSCTTPVGPWGLNSEEPNDCRGSTLNINDGEGFIVSTTSSAFVIIVPAGASEQVGGSGTLISRTSLTGTPGVCNVTGSTVSPVAGSMDVCVITFSYAFSTGTATGTITLNTERDAMFPTVSRFAGTMALTISGGPFGTAPAATPTQNVAQRQSSANKSAAAAFSRATIATQTFVTQTQTQNRLIDECEINPTSSRECNPQGTTFSARQLALAYGETIDRPGASTWHSKDILGQYRKKQLAEQRDKEQRARAGLNKLGVDSTAELTQPAAYTSKWDLWAAGGLSKIDSSQSGNNLDGDLIFGRSGFDYLLSRNLLIGAFGGFDKADAEFQNFNIELDSRAKVAGFYLGYKLSRATTGLPVDFILDAQASHSWLDYDIRDNASATAGDFDATRFAGSVNLTAVILRSVGQRGNIKILPKIGLAYTNEKQDGYSDSGGNAVASQSITLGQLSFGSSIFVPVTRELEVFGRAEGQWDFKDVGVIATSTGGTYQPDDFGVILGGGIRAALGSATTLRLEGAAEGIGRKDYDQYSFSSRVDFRF